MYIYSTSFKSRVKNVKSRVKNIAGREKNAIFAENLRS
jgi:hypothetical protein